LEYLSFLETTLKHNNLLFLLEPDSDMSWWHHQSKWRIKSICRKTL